MYISRHIENSILEASKSYPVIMVCGQRQVGKSTMLYHIREKSRAYVTLDDANARRLAKEDAGLFFESFGFPILIDEIQRVPELLLEIKKIVDLRALNGERTAGLFWLTGSQKFKMMKNVSDSLAGRIAIFDMSGLTGAEISGVRYDEFDPDISMLKEKAYEKPDVHQVFEKIFTGSMPKIITGEAERDRYYMDYVNTYLERDIKELSQVGKLDAFYDFLVCMAARTAQELVYEDIARTVGVSSPTIKEWVSILERSGVIFILRPYHTNINKRLVKTPKIYFLDTGIVAYLCRWPDAMTLENGAMNGAFFETFVVSEIVKNRYNGGKAPDLFYYRDVDKLEVDLLILRGRDVYPVEIKKNKMPDRPDKNFRVLDKLGLNIKTGLCICLSDELVPYSRACWLCPVTLI